MKAMEVSVWATSLSNHVTKTFFITLFACVVVPAALAGKPDGKGGGKGDGGDDGGGDPAVTPPVTYSIQWLTPPVGMGYRLQDINDNGWTSGQIITDDVPYAAVVFMADGTPIDLNSQAPLPSEDGYYMAGGYRINNSGVVVGGAYNPATDQWRSYRFLPAGLRDTVPVSEILPETALYPGLNNFGDVACLMPETASVRVFPLDSSESPWDYFPNQVQGVRRITDFNDQLQMLYLGPWFDGLNGNYRYTPITDKLDTFVSYTVAHMNNSGEIAAKLDLPKRSDSDKLVTYRDGVGETVILEKDGGYPTDINDFGEVVGLASQRNLTNYVYFPSDGLWNVNDLVADGGDAKWQSAEISLEAINNNGQIAGTAEVVAANGEIVSEGFILTPVVP